MYTVQTIDQMLQYQFSNFNISQNIGFIFGDQKMGNCLKLVLWKVFSAPFFDDHMLEEGIKAYNLHYYVRERGLANKISEKVSFKLQVVADTRRENLWKFTLSSVYLSTNSKYFSKAVCKQYNSFYVKIKYSNV